MKIALKGINKATKRLASGKRVTYWYHRESGKRLPGAPGSAEFLSAYQDAERIAPRDNGTVSGLIREYLSSPRFGRNRKGKERPESTKREYKRLLARCEEEFGTMPVNALSSPKVIGEFIDWQEQVGLDHPREADNRLTVLSAVFSYARSKGRIARNPLDGFERLYFSDRSELIWTEPDIRKFMDGAPIELQRALILAIHTGQRYGDLIRLRWSDYDGNYLRLKQRKTGAHVAVKVTATLRTMLDSAPKSCPFTLSRADGRPWHTAKNDKALGYAWRERMKASGLYDKDPQERLHLADLRGTAVTLLAEAGCTVPEIVSITGHTMKSANAILEKYLARTKAISDAAMLKFENAEVTIFANQLRTDNH
ncbi:MAG TPA: tyrosine-type recombinase/integrase [Rhizomicrobium sp.]|nr:tyrosine-type recombinase/integrase [Rhizomicrobium sp.]